MSYDDVISAVDNFLTNGIQTLQHWWNMCVGRKRYYVEKTTSFGHIPGEYLDQLMNFSADPRVEMQRLKIEDVSVSQFCNYWFMADNICQGQLIDKWNCKQKYLCKKNLKIKTKHMKILIDSQAMLTSYQLKGHVSHKKCTNERFQIYSRAAAVNLERNSLVGCVLQHINPCRLFNAKSCLYIHIEYICFVNEWFVGNNPTLRWFQVLLFIVWFNQ